MHYEINTRYDFGALFLSEAARSYDFHFEVTLAISQAKLYFAQARRTKHLAPHQLPWAQTLDKLAEAALSPRPPPTAHISKEDNVLLHGSVKFSCLSNY